MEVKKNREGGRKRDRMKVLLPSLDCEWLKEKAEESGISFTAFFRLLVTKALQRETLPSYSGRKCNLDIPSEVYETLVKKAKSLGYPTRSEFVRTLVRLQIEEFEKQGESILW
jgi:hypothetical protein